MQIRRDIFSGSKGAILVHEDWKKSAGYNPREKVPVSLGGTTGVKAGAVTPVDPEDREGLLPSWQSSFHARGTSAGC
jgi:hypothetical protein